MADQPKIDEEQIIQQLAELDQDPAAAVDSTVRELHAELLTLDNLLRQPVPPDPYAEESACQRAIVEACEQIGEPATAIGVDSRVTVGPGPTVGTMIGPYRLVNKLGRGGMGELFVAEDTELGRRVALKVMLPTVAANPAARQRFLREARAAAKLHNQHVAAIYQVGEDQETPYLAMELLEGQPLDAYLAANAVVPAAEIIRIGRDIALGLQAAHEQGLIHRDIKPGNLWLENTPQRRVKILDFGLARIESEDIHLTQSGVIVGTPAYMAPEQARAEKGIDGRADLFSLGCVLYRLATGDIPFKGDNTMAVLLAIANSQPRPPREVNPAIPRTLSDLILQLLHKEASKRPASAAEVVARLDQINQELARPPRRRRSFVAALATLAVGMAALAGAVVWKLETNKGTLVVEIDDPNVDVVLKQNGVVVQDKTTQREFVLKAGDGEVLVTNKDGLELAAKQFTLKRGGTTTVTVTLQQRADSGKPPPKPPEVRPPVVRPPLPVGASPFDALRREDISAYELKAAGDGDPKQAPAELVAVFGDSRLNPHRGLIDIVFSPDGRQLLTYGFPLILWDATTGERIRVLNESGGSGKSGARFSRDGQRLIASINDQVIVWEVATGKQLRSWRPDPETKNAVQFALSADGRLATVQSKERPRIDLWDSAEGNKQLLSLPVNLNGVGWFIRNLVFSPDGKRLAASACHNNSPTWIKVWDLDSGKELLSCAGSKLFHYPDLTFSLDGKELMACDRDHLQGGIRIWNIATGQERPGLITNRRIHTMTFSPDHKFLAYAADDGVILREMASKNERLIFRKRGPDVARSLVFSPDGQCLVIATDNRGIVLWDVAAGKERLPRQGHGGSITQVKVSPDSRTIASAGADGTVRLWDVVRGEARTVLSATDLFESLAFRPDGQEITAVTGSGIKVWSLTQEKELPAVPARLNVRQIAYSPDGMRLAVLTHMLRPVDVWQIRTQSILFQAGPNAIKRPLSHVAFSPNGKTLAVSMAMSGANSGEWTISLCDPANGAEVRRLNIENGRAEFAFSPDGEQLLAATRPPILWDVATGRQQRIFRDDDGFGDYSLPVFSPDGRTVAVFRQYLNQAALIVWDVATNARVKSIKLTPSTVPRDLTYTPDGRHLVAASANGVLAVYRLAEAPKTTNQTPPAGPAIPPAGK